MHNILILRNTRKFSMKFYFIIEYLPNGCCSYDHDIERKGVNILNDNKDVDDGLFVGIDIK